MCHRPRTVQELTRVIRRRASKWMSRHEGKISKALYSWRAAEFAFTHAPVLAARPRQLQEVERALGASLTGDQDA